MVFLKQFHITQINQRAFNSIRVRIYLSPLPHIPRKKVVTLVYYIFILKFLCVTCKTQVLINYKIENEVGKNVIYVYYVCTVMMSRCRFSYLKFIPNYFKFNCNIKISRALLLTLIFLVCVKFYIRLQLCFILHKISKANSKYQLTFLKQTKFIIYCMC